MLGGIDGDGIAGGIFVDIGGAMADPLAPGVHGNTDVEFDFAHFEGGGVGIAQQIADETAILMHLLGAGPVGDSGCLDDSSVVAHVVDDADESVVQHRKGLTEHGIERFGGGARRCCRGVGGDVGHGGHRWLRIRGERGVRTVAS